MWTLRRWRTGLAVAAVSFLVGAVRLVATGSTGWLTWVWFVIAAVYAFVALVARRVVFPERPQDWLGRVERPRFAALVPHGRTRAVGGSVGPASGHLRQGSDEAVTRNRIANALVVLAAIVGMVLVLTGTGRT